MSGGLSRRVVLAIAALAISAWQHPVLSVAEHRSNGDFAADLDDRVDRKL